MFFRPCPYSFQPFHHRSRNATRHDERAGPARLLSLAGGPHLGLLTPSLHMFIPLTYRSKLIGRRGRVPGAMILADVTDVRVLVGCCHGKGKGEGDEHVPPGPGEHLGHGEQASTTSGHPTSRARQAISPCHPRDVRP